MQPAGFAADPVLQLPGPARGHGNGAPKLPGIKKASTVSDNQRFISVGVTRFELATTRPPDAYSNRAELHPEILFQSISASFRGALVFKSDAKLRPFDELCKFFG